MIALALLVGLGSYAAAGPVRVGPVTDPIGVVRVARGQPLTIAYWLVISGPNTSFGIDSRRGIEIAIADKPTVAGHRVRLIGEDSLCNAEGGVAAATRMAANREIVAAVGSSCSSEAVPGAPILWRAGISTVSPSNTAPRLTAPDRGPGFDGYLRTAFNDKVQGRAVAQFAYHALHSRRAATIHDGSPYSEGLARVFAEVYRRMGGTITAEEAIAPGDTDMRPMLTRIAVGRPDVIFYPVFVAESGHITRQAREIAGLERSRLIGADASFSPDFLRAAGPAARGKFLSGPDLSEEALGPRYTEFVRKYRARYGELPLAKFHAHAYDATMMVFAAIERVARKDAAGNTFIGRRALRDALFATRNFRGITGNLTCNAFGDCADPIISLYEVVSADPAKWDIGRDPKRVWPRR
jgi:branched-chain amino acid transport system substrate-binding protein